MYHFLCTLVKGFCSLFFSVRMEGSENLPAEGGFMLCCNHISNWDPPMLQAFIRRRIYFMAKDELFHVFGLGMLLRKIKAIPVKRSGADITAIKSAFRVIGKNDVLGIFPTGQRAINGDEGTVKSGVGLIAVKTGTTVIPVHITATYKFFSKVQIHIGKPIDFSVYKGKKPDSDMLCELSNQIYDHIKALA